MECKFTVGQKVVCIGETSHQKGPRRGREYEIEELCPRRFASGRVGIYLGLKGFDSKIYLHRLFRPAQEHTTNISVFTGVVEPADA
jgi:hypothetical protein